MGKPSLIELGSEAWQTWHVLLGKQVNQLPQAWQVLSEFMLYHLSIISDGLRIRQCLRRSRAQRGAVQQDLHCALSGCLGHRIYKIFAKS